MALISQEDHHQSSVDQQQQQQQQLYSDQIQECPNQSTRSSSSSSSVMLLPVDPEPHMSSQFYTFNRASHRLMVLCLMSARHPTPDEIRGVATPAVLASWRGVWKDRQEDTAYVTGWRRIQDKLLAQVDDVGNEVLFFKNNPYQFVPFIEQWAGIVQQFHVGSDLRHASHKETLERMREVWTVGAKLYGVPESYVKVCISTCPLCSSQKQPPPEHPADRATTGQRSGQQDDSGQTGQTQQPRRKRFEYTESFEVAARDVPQRLQLLADKYKVVLCIRQKYIRYKPFLAEVKDYCCHRGGEPTGRKPGVLKRKRYMSKRCGCSFRIRAIVPITNYDEKEKSFSYQEDGVATFKLYAVHSGHEPGPHEGSARIIHRFVDPTSGGGGGGGDGGGRDEDEVREGVLRQIQKLKIELGGFEGKLGGICLELLDGVCQEISGSLQRIRGLRLDFGKLRAAAVADDEDEQEQEQEQDDEQEEEQQQSRSSSLKKLSCNCCLEEGGGSSGVFCKSCCEEQQSNNGASCSEEGSLDMSSYCAESDKWYEGMGCGIDAAAAAHDVELGFGHAIS